MRWDLGTCNCDCHCNCLVGAKRTEESIPVRVNEASCDAMTD